MKQVYDAYSKTVVFEGTEEECWNWIINQAEHYNGKCFYRTWTENNDTYYDVGRVYIFNK